jgi:hypothetical protein
MGCVALGTHHLRGNHWHCQERSSAERMEKAEMPLERYGEAYGKRNNIKYSTAHHHSGKCSSSEPWDGKRIAERLALDREDKDSTEHFIPYFPITTIRSRGQRNCKGSSICSNFIHQIFAE